MSVNPGMDWQQVCTVADLIPEDVTPFEIGGVSIAVCVVEARCYAFANRCSHEAVELTGGFLDGTEIECPLHGARFCVKTGRCLSPPATVDIVVYPARVEGGLLYVQLGGA